MGDVYEAIDIQFWSRERFGVNMQIWGHHCVCNGARSEVAEIAQGA